VKAPTAGRPGPAVTPPSATTSAGRRRTEGFSGADDDDLGAWQAVEGEAEAGAEEAADDDDAGATGGRAGRRLHGDDLRRPAVAETRRQQERACVVVARTADLDVDGGEAARRCRHEGQGARRHPHQQLEIIDGIEDPGRDAAEGDDVVGAQPGTRQPDIDAAGVRSLIGGHKEQQRRTKEAEAAGQQALLTVGIPDDDIGGAGGGGRGGADEAGVVSIDEHLDVDAGSAADEDLGQVGVVEEAARDGDPRPAVAVAGAGFHTVDAWRLAVGERAGALAAVGVDDDDVDDATPTRRCDAADGRLVEPLGLAAGDVVDEDADIVGEGCAGDGDGRAADGRTDVGRDDVHPRRRREGEAAASGHDGPRLSDRDVDDTDVVGRRDHPQRGGVEALDVGGGDAAEVDDGVGSEAVAANHHDGPARCRAARRLESLHRESAGAVAHNQLVGLRREVGRVEGAGPGGVAHLDGEADRRAGGRAGEAADEGSAGRVGEGGAGDGRQLVDGAPPLDPQRRGAEAVVGARADPHLVRTRHDATGVVGVDVEDHGRIVAGAEPRGDEEQGPRAHGSYFFLAGGVVIGVLVAAPFAEGAARAASSRRACSRRARGSGARGLGRFTGRGGAAARPGAGAGPVASPSPAASRRGALGASASSPRGGARPSTSPKPASGAGRQARARRSASSTTCWMRSGSVAMPVPAIWRGSTRRCSAMPRGYQSASVVACSRLDAPLAFWRRPVAPW
jgi:hypothetical protein